VTRKSGCTKCANDRCLFDSTESILPSKFAVVTNETREGEGLWESCEYCGLVINRNGVAPDNVEAFYNETYQDKNSFQRGDKISARQHFDIRLKSIKPRAEYLSNHINEEAIVFELGAGSGELLALLKPKARKCVGNELCQEFVDFMQSELDISASSEDYLNITPAEKWDLAISIGTLDHIFNTRRYVEKLFSDIKPGGLLYVEVPNDNQALKNFVPGAHAGAFRRFMYQTAHYYSFTFDTLRRLLTEVGFCIEDEFSRHDYSLINYLNWCLTGKPQTSIIEAKSNSTIFHGGSPFEAEMNSLLGEADMRFYSAITKHKFGESICMLVRKPRKL